MKNEFPVVDFAIPYDSRVDKKKRIREVREISRPGQGPYELWSVIFWIIPIVIAVLKTTPEDLDKRLKEIELRPKLLNCRKQ